MTIDINYGAIAGYSLFLYGIVCLVRRRFASLALLSLALVGLGETPMPPFGYAAVLLAIQGIGIVLALLFYRRESAIGPKLITYAPWPFCLLLLITVVLVLKNIRYCLSGNLDSVWIRDAIVTSTTAVILPTTLLMVCFMRQYWRIVIRDFMVGVLIISVLWVGFGLLGQLQLRPGGIDLNSDGRLAFHGRDTITSVRLLPWMLAALMFLLIMGRSMWTRLSCVLLISCIVVIMFLNGTRQTALSMVALMGCISVLGRGNRLAGLVVSAAILGLIGLLITVFGADRGLPARVSAEIAAADGRWAYWSRARAFANEYALLGGGFRSFGDVITSIDPETKMVVVSKDYAHGLVMDMLTDHGYPITLAFLVATAACFAVTVRRAVKSENKEIRIVCIMFLSFPIALIFSGTHWNGTMFYVPALLCAAGLAGEKYERTAACRRAAVSSSACSRNIAPSASPQSGS